MRSRVRLVLLACAAAMLGTGCSDLEGPNAGAWPSRSVAFVGGGDQEGLVGLASPSASGRVWPDAVPEGVLPLEMRWAEGGGVLVTRTDSSLYAWDVAADESRDLGAVPYGDVALRGPSPDGEHVALDVTTDVGLARQRINLVHVATGDDVGAATGCAVERFVWGAAAGEAFAIERHCPHDSPATTERAVVHIADGATTTLAVHPSSVELDIAASPDGQWLLVVGDAGVERLDLQGGAALVIESEPRARIGPGWSADSTWIAFIDRTLEEVVLSRADGTDRRTIGPAATWARFAPGGRLLVVQRPCGGGAELVGVDPESGAQHTVAACTSLENPQWSPDGAAIVFRSPCDADTTSVEFAGADGAKLGGSDCARFGGVLRWSPDSDAITTTVADKNVPLGITVVRRDGARRRLADGNGPHWRG